MPKHATQPVAAPEPTPEPESREKRQARIEKLRLMIQQASSPHGDGLQAAWRVCALIRKHGLDIVDPVLIDELYEQNHQLKAELEAAKAGFVEDPDDDGFGPGPRVHTQAPHYMHTMTYSSAQVSPSPYGSPYASPPPPASPSPGSSGFGPNFFSNFQQPSPTPPAAPTPPPSPPSGSGGMTSPAFIKASQFAGKCRHCGKVINVGDPVRWMKKVGVWCPHTSCYNDWVSGNKAAANFNPFP